MDDKLEESIRDFASKQGNCKCLSTLKRLNKFYKKNLVEIKSQIARNCFYQIDFKCKYRIIFFFVID